MTKEEMEKIDSLSEELTSEYIRIVEVVNKYEKRLKFNDRLAVVGTISIWVGVILQIIRIFI